MNTVKHILFLRFMKGWRTIGANLIALIFSLLPLWGIEVDSATQNQISIGVLAIVNMLLRYDTNTAVGKSS